MGSTAVLEAVCTLARVAVLIQVPAAVCTLALAEASTLDQAGAFIRGRAVAFTPAPMAVFTLVPAAASTLDLMGSCMLGREVAYTLDRATIRETGRRCRG